MYRIIYLPTGQYVEYKSKPVNYFNRENAETIVSTYRIFYDGSTPFIGAFFDPPIHPIKKHLLEIVEVPDV